MSTYVVCDIEADGPIPGPHSMISLGAVAVNQVGKELGEFEINFLPLENAKPHPNVMKWFTTHAPEALKYTKYNQVSPKTGMKKFGNWLLTLPSPRVMAAHPAPFDFMWVNWYIQTFLADQLEEPPFTYPFFDIKGQAALDIKSYAAAVLGKDYREIHRDNYPPEFHDNTKHSHKAIEDAREYAQLLIKLLNKN
tara:strand:+ start:201 stop:782 length:582 start_codon:yes stop_codon:yes gene_type:complete